MYGKRVDAVLWNDFDNPVRGEDKRTKFIANYIFDDGFASLEECASAVPDPEKWAYVCFCENWYAINAQSYISLISVSKEAVYVKESFDTISRQKKIPKFIRSHDIGPVFWANGIFCDLADIDPYLMVVRYDGVPFLDIVTISNTVVAFGMLFFATDICIRTDNYVWHVFPHYFSSNSMKYKIEKIRNLRKHGFQYWNPFSNNVAVNERDKNKQKRIRENNINFE